MKKILLFFKRIWWHIQDLWYVPALLFFFLVPSAHAAITLNGSYSTSTDYTFYFYKNSYFGLVGIPISQIQLVGTSPSSAAGMPIDVDCNSVTTGWGTNGLTNCQNSTSTPLQFMNLLFHSSSSFLYGTTTLYSSIYDIQQGIVGNTTTLTSQSSTAYLAIGTLDPTLRGTRDADGINILNNINSSSSIYAVLNPNGIDYPSISFLFPTNGTTTPNFTALQYQISGPRSAMDYYDVIGVWSRTSTAMTDSILDSNGYTIQTLPQLYPSSKVHPAGSITWLGINQFLPVGGTFATGTWYGKLYLYASSTSYFTQSLPHNSDLIATSSLISWTIATGTTYQNDLTSYATSTSGAIYCNFATADFLTDPIGNIKQAMCEGLGYLFVPTLAQSESLSQNLQATVQTISQAPPFNVISNSRTGLENATSTATTTISQYTNQGSIGNFFNSTRTIFGSIIWLLFGVAAIRTIMLL